MAYNDLKILLKEISSTIEDAGDLFGKELRNFITENGKAKNQTMTVLKPGKQMKPFRSEKWWGTGAEKVCALPKESSKQSEEQLPCKINRRAYSFG